MSRGKFWRRHNGGGQRPRRGGLLFRRGKVCAVWRSSCWDRLGILAGQCRRFFGQRSGRGCGSWARLCAGEALRRRRLSFPRSRHFPSLPRCKLRKSCLPARDFISRRLRRLLNADPDLTLCKPGRRGGLGSRKVICLSAAGSTLSHLAPVQTPAESSSSPLRTILFPSLPARMQG